MSNKVLVTGASGFLGSRIVRQLVEAGEQVRALVRASSSRAALAGLPASQVEVIEGDVMIGHTIYRSLAGCDRLFHVAAQNQLWSRKPQSIIDAAVIGTREVLSAAEKRGLRRVVYTSSVATLGTTSVAEEMDESHPFNLQQPDSYVQAKVQAEEVAREFASKLDLVTVLPSVLIGPGDTKPTPGGRGLLEFLSWDLPFIDFPVVDGGLSYADVDDVARGHLLAMQKGRAGESYILGGENLTYEQFFNSASELTALPGPGAPSSASVAMLVARLTELRARLGGPEPIITAGVVRDYAGAYAWVSSAKAQSELGYTQRPARKAIARAIEWFITNGYVKPGQAKRIRVDLRVPALEPARARCVTTPACVAGVSSPAPQTLVQ